jgi:hypothetical protein
LVDQEMSCYKQRKDRQYSVECCRPDDYPWVSVETEGRLLRLLFSIPSGMDFRYSLSPPVTNTFSCDLAALYQEILDPHDIRIVKS